MTQATSPIAIIGAGLTGLSTALALHSRGIACYIIDKADISAKYSTILDFRGIALTPSSVAALGEWGMAETLQAHASPIHHIDVTDASDPAHAPHVTFDSDSSGPLGYIIEGAALLSSLYETVCARAIPLYSGHDICHSHMHDDSMTLETDTGESFHASLVLACDGKYSAMRAMQAIACDTTLYHQKASLFLLQHARHHDYRAYEDFYPHGAFALLPMQGGHHSSIVWIEASHTADHLATLPQPVIHGILEQRLGGRLGEYTIEQGPASYPLQAILAQEYYNEGVLLLGDACHAIHPLAGQGFNQGLGDISALLSLITHYHSLGLPLTHHALGEDYRAARKQDNERMFLLTDGLDMLFRPSMQWARPFRLAGMDVVNSFPLLKHTLQHYATGAR